MSIYDDLILTGRYSFVEKEQNKCLVLKEKKLPISIKLSEFEYIEKIIEENDCKRGYEIATGFGISSLAAGFGFKKTNGKLVTMDSYIEETLDSYIYPSILKVNNKSIGYESINCLIKEYCLQNIIFPKIGLSPIDVDKVLQEEFIDIEDSKLDYIFIDGEHRVDAVERDILSVKKYINEKTIVLFHDIENNFGNGVKKIVKNILNRDLIVEVPQPNGFGLAKLI